MIGASLRRGRADADVPTRAQPGSVVLQAHGLGVRRGDRLVLDGVDLVLRAGEVVALVGPNGAGKSTLLGALTGDLSLATGGIELFGRPMQDWPTLELARRRAVLPQQVAVSFPFSVREIVGMGRAPWARTADCQLDDELIDRAIAAVDLEGFAGRSFTTLSGGERARAALARVLAQDTQVLLLDEPTAALDLRHQELVFELVGRHAARGGAVVAVVHDLGLAAAYAQRVVLLDRGQVVAAGRPEQVLTPEILGSVYRHDVEVLRHPHDGSLLVLPRRTPLSSSHA